MQENDKPEYIEDENKRMIVVGRSLWMMLAIVIFFFFAMYCLSGCTISISNVMASGSASDVVDSSPTTETTADATVPISPM